MTGTWTQLPTNLVSALVKAAFFQAIALKYFFFCSSMRENDWGGVLVAAYMLVPICGFGFLIFLRLVATFFGQSGMMSVPEDKDLRQGHSSQNSATWTRTADWPTSKLVVVGQTGFRVQNEFPCYWCPSRCMVLFLVSFGTDPGALQHVNFCFYWFLFSWSSGALASNNCFLPSQNRGRQGCQVTWFVSRIQSCMYVCFLELATPNRKLKITLTPFSRSRLLDGLLNGNTNFMSNKIGCQKRCQSECQIKCPHFD